MEKMGGCNPDSVNQLALIEDDMVDKLRVIEKFLTYWLPLGVRSQQCDGAVPASE